MDAVNRGVAIALRLMLLRDYLETHASRTQAVTRAELLSLLKNNDLAVERKSLYRYTAMLETYFHMELEYSAYYRGYILLNPPFEPYELRLMIDSVQASKFITQEKANIICGKIRRNFADSSTAPALSRKAYVTDRIRSMNDSVVKESGKLHEAIESNRKIGFRYCHYTPDKNNRKSYSKHGEMYVVSPFALCWDNGNYYLYAHDGKKFRYFRVDRMERITAPLDEPREAVEEYKGLNDKQRKAKVFQMYSGKEYRVKMRFRNELTDAVIDQFGADTFTVPIDEEHFTITVPVEISPPFFAWIATFGRKAKILEPEPVVKEMKKFLQKSLEMYEDDGEM
jgi:predicted DNA-binding transcriptional regulator YafY